MKRSLKHLFSAFAILLYVFANVGFGVHKCSVEGFEGIVYAGEGYCHCEGHNHGHCDCCDHHHNCTHFHQSECCNTEFFKISEVQDTFDGEDHLELSFQSYFTFCDIPVSMPELGCPQATPADFALHRAGPLIAKLNVRRL